MSLFWGPVFARAKEARTEPPEHRDPGAYRLGGQNLFWLERATLERAACRLADEEPAFAAIAQTQPSRRFWVKAEAKAKAEAEGRPALEFQPGPPA